MQHRIVGVAAHIARCRATLAAPLLQQKVRPHEAAHNIGAVPTREHYSAMYGAQRMAMQPGTVQQCITRPCTAVHCRACCSGTRRSGSEQCNTGQHDVQQRQRSTTIHKARAMQPSYQHTQQQLAALNTRQQGDRPAGTLYWRMVDPDVLLHVVFYPGIHMACGRFLQHAN
jgi:hypothetical protein